MQIIEVRGESKSLDSAFDIFLDVSCRIGDTAISGENIEAAFRGNYSQIIRLNAFQRIHICLKLTKNLVADIVFPDEVS